MPHQFEPQKESLKQAYRQAKQHHDLDAMVRHWSGIVDTLWAQWEDCFQLDEWIEELSDLRQLIEQQQRPDCLPYLAKGAFAAFSIRDMGHPDFDFWEALNLQYLEGELSVEERLIRSLQCMIHYTWGIGNQPKASLILDYLKIILREDNSSGMVQCIYPVCLAAYQFWFEPDPARSTQTIDEGLQLSQRLNLSVWDVPMLNVALFVTCSCQQETQANQYLEALQQRLDENSRPHDFAIFYHFKAYLAWLGNDLNEALFAAEKALRIAEQTGFSFSPIYYELAVAQILNDLGRGDEALTHALKLRHQAQLYKSRNLELMALAIASHIAISNAQFSIADEMTRDLMALAQAGKFQRMPWLRQQDAQRIAQFYSAKASAEHELPDFLRAASSANRRKKQISTLGALRITSTQKGGKKPPRVLIALLLQLIAAGREGLSRQQIMEATWPGIEASGARNRLKTSLYRLRKLLGEEQALLQQHGCIMLNSELFEIDCWEFVDAYKNALDDPARLQHALKRYSGKFDISLCDNANLQLYQLQLESMQADMVLKLVKHYTSGHQYSAAQLQLQKALQQDAVNEEFCLALLEVTELMGNQHEVPALLQRFEDNFKALLDLPLPARIEQNGQQIMRSESVV